MYEQPKTSAVGRIVWFIISLLIIAGIVWLILWFFFWRQPSAKTTETSKGTTQSTKQSGSSTSSDKGSSSSSAGSSSSSTTGSSSMPTSLGQVVEETSSGTGTSPTTTLVNTGPGDIVTPIVVAVIGGVAFYQIRLRRRFVSEVE